ncbi:MAG TPA: sn-glycerol-1-phosphate dehydrogenase [Lacipirellulaceae bacterium]|nr:sn-glycerol-1-phosphate dehydrogenase [Lacipirellulaceae bacterium]
MSADDALVESALRRARDTRKLVVAAGANQQAPTVFGELFGESPCIVIADDNTFAAAGKGVQELLRASGRKCLEPLVMEARGLYAEYSYVTRIQNALKDNDAIPVAVGSGSINDLTKLASHLSGRQYLSVATAASMDGYTAFGASITHEGSKQTFDCPAPIGVVADLNVIAAAPEGLNASGYADLVAKVPAGLDWLLADSLGIDAVDPEIWEMVQSRLDVWMSDAAGVKRRDLEVTRRLTLALMVTGFAMQASCSSRPVSGAEHQFSHLWDMEHHTYRGITPSHGFKVGIGSLASLGLYEAVLARDFEQLDVDAAVKAWPTQAENDAEIEMLFEIPELRQKAILESTTKYIDHAALREQLEQLKHDWPQIRGRLSQRMLTVDALHDMLQAAGCPVRSEDIGISRERLRISFRKAYHIRRRFTIFDLIRRANIWDHCLDQVFSKAK